MIYPEFTIRRDWPPSLVFGRTQWQADEQESFRVETGGFSYVPIGGCCGKA
jgi:hypothetical protein